LPVESKRDHIDEPVGSSFQSFLEEAGIAEEVHAIAIARVTAWQEQKTMRALKAEEEATR
jgi:hypothetical protein